MIGRLVLLLLAANLAWLAWSQGWLRPLGLAPAVHGEPERLQRQLRPDALTLRAPDGRAPTPRAAAASAPAAATPPAVTEPGASASAPVEGVCLQAGSFDEAQAEALRRAASASLPAGSWRIEPVQLPGRWMVYIGKLADAEAVRAKRAELRALGVDTDRPGTALEPGLSLGRFPTEEAAERGLDQLTRKGVRTARVLQERRDTPAYLLRLPAADAALRQQAARSLREPLGGRDWRACD